MTAYPSVDTRGRKREPRREELEAKWREVANERGIAKQKSRKVGVRNPEPTPALEIAWRAIGQLEERASVFPVHSAPALALAHSPGVQSWARPFRVGGTHARPRDRPWLPDPAMVPRPLPRGRGR